MNITRQAATITHIALMLASGRLSQDRRFGAEATPGTTSEATAATGAGDQQPLFHSNSS